ncbi:MAG TPA: restriction endonuclease subunit S [Chitinophagales bacterium]|nr:restriction endonuclease subunit S [Chitinophagales bacterium]HMW94768.1 restriction endonuclease subunit S [Chitinophagales bacterium]HMY42685.1 restriction endonuclease subunit S [Chitinophagales bacterium]HMZ94274.1 restriction endonuclease subunit S [Chitinophagales bacterium]HNB39238.1 restriction endonuclease subunit S [Chitinophagales bacterium]
MVEKFKNTEIGEYPNDWIVEDFGEIISSVQLGGNYPNNDEDGEFILIKMGNLNRGYIDLKKKYYIKKGITPNEIDRLHFGDVIFNTRNTLDLVGKVAIWKNEINPAFFNSNIMRIKFNEEKISSNDFMNLILNTPNSLYQLRGIATGTTSVAAIYPRDLFKIKIPLPTKAEQTAIATALNDADALIQKLEQLIAKKRNIKTGAMQELLKPKEGWEWTTVDKLGKPFGGLSGKAKADFKDGNCPYIPFMNVMSNPIIDTTYFDYVKITPTESQHKAEKGDLFFNGSSETPEEVGMCSVLLEDIPNLYLNSFCFGFRLFKEQKNNGLYLAYFFRSSYGRKIFYILAQGATRHNLSKSNFLKIEIQIPEPDEQVKIATILRDIDDEIQELEKQLEKYKMIKQGMMQSLLTGKIRLV